MTLTAASVVRRRPWLPVVAQFTSLLQMRWGCRSIDIAVTIVWGRGTRLVGSMRGLMVFELQKDPRTTEVNEVVVREKSTVSNG
jgi:hypothetical protein